MSSDPRRLDQLRSEVRDWYARFDSETMSLSEFTGWIEGMVKLQTAYAIERSAQHFAQKAEAVAKEAEGKVQ